MCCPFLDTAQCLTAALSPESPLNAVFFIKYGSPHTFEGSALNCRRNAADAALMTQLLSRSTSWQ